MTLAEAQKEKSLVEKWKRDGKITVEPSRSTKSILQGAYRSGFKKAKPSK